MRVEEQKPHQALSGCINRYLDLEATPEEMPEWKIFPTGYSYLTYVYGEPAMAKVGEKNSVLPRFFIGGQVSTQEITLLPQSEFGHFGIEFHPCALHKMFSIDMGKAANTFLDFENEISDKQDILVLKDLLSKPAPFAEKCGLLDEYFLAKINDLPSDLHVSKAVDIVNQSNGLISVKELAGSVGLSERQLRRQFLKACGIGPQKYAKIIQFKSVFRLIEKGEDYKLKDLAYDSAFFDVSHFIRTFKELIGENPRGFLDSDDQFIQVYLKNG